MGELRSTMLQIALHDLLKPLLALLWKGPQLRSDLKKWTNWIWTRPGSWICAALGDSKVPIGSVDGQSDG